MRRRGIKKETLSKKTEKYIAENTERQLKAGKRWGKHKEVIFSTCVVMVLLLIHLVG